MAQAGVIVPGEGNLQAEWAIVGERPGEEEGHQRRPFVGKTGREQDRHLERNGLRRRDGYLTNLVKDYQPGNPSPEPEDVARWGPELLKELRRVRPKFIIAAGYHSIQFFLGPNAYLEAVHGIPHTWSDGNGLSAVILPTYHPAAHFYQPDLLQHIVYDYKRAADAIRGRIPVDPPRDEFPDPVYLDLGDSDPAAITMALGSSPVIATDTEGVPGDEWSWQATSVPGTALVCRRSSRLFKEYLGRFKRAIKGKTLVGHNIMYEIEMFQSMGLDILDPSLGVTLFDTMMAAYLLCIEPQSLKMLARRHCGMEMNEYAEVVGDVGVEKQLAYLERVLAEDWPDPEPRIEYGNDGTTRLYKPQPVRRRAEAILVDRYSDKRDQSGNPVDPQKRWRQVDRELRRMVERRLGPMPIGTLADIPLPDALRYAGRDPDATLRLYPKLRLALEANDLIYLMNLKMRMLPMIASMKITGIIGRRQAFEQLRDRMNDEMEKYRSKIARQYFKGKPFNPASAPQTRTLLRKLGLKGEKKTATGLISTSKKSIEHLRYESKAIDDLEQWRERQKCRDSFATPVLNNWPDNPAITRCRIRCDIKITRVTSGRFSGSLLEGEPSAPLLAIPVRNELGKSVRECYEADDGYNLGSFDLDQAEMRLMADESRDAGLVRLFNDGKIDVHGSTAAKMFGVHYDTAMAKENKMKYRYPAKRVGFGVITGIQGPGLLDQLRMAGVLNYDLDDCERFIREFLRIYPGVKDYMLWCREECRRNGGVIRDRWGMPRYLPAILDDSREGKWDRLEAERQTHSHRIQGGAQGMIQNSMGWLWGQLRPFGDAVRYILQIHDELIFEVAEGMEEIVEPIIIKGLVHHGAKLVVPVKSSGSWAKRWGSLKD